MLEKQVLSYTEHLVERGPYHIYAREYPGEEPAIVLMHGFPDNLHLYDRLLPWLITSRRVVTFDFLGWGNLPNPLDTPIQLRIKRWISTQSFRRRIRLHIGF